MVALVTGAGGGEIGGIGAGVARCLGEQGARVAVNDLYADYVNKTVQQLQSLGIEAWALVGSVADSAQATGLVAGTVEHFGQLDILVNNAGISSRSPVMHMPDEEWLRVLGVNLNGPFFPSRATVPFMRARGFGRIINIASVAGIRISMGSASYTASKTALLALTRQLAAEVAQYGITVNAILPGATLTPLLKTNAPADIMTKHVNSSPSRRLAEPEEMGRLATFLASREAGYITGADIPVDGGLTLLPGDFDSYQAFSGEEPS